MSIPTRAVVFLPGSDMHCQNISIADDSVREETQNISLGLNTTDSQVLLISNFANIIIIDDDSE